MHGSVSCTHFCTDVHTQGWGGERKSGRGMDGGKGVGWTDKLTKARYDLDERVSQLNIFALSTGDWIQDLTHMRQRLSRRDTAPASFPHFILEQVLRLVLSSLCLPYWPWTCESIASSSRAAGFTGLGHQARSEYPILRYSNPGLSSFDGQDKRVKYELSKS